MVYKAKPGNTLETLRLKNFAKEQLTFMSTEYLYLIYDDLESYRKLNMIKKLNPNAEEIQMHTSIYLSHLKAFKDNIYIDLEMGEQV